MKQRLIKLLGTCAVVAAAANANAFPLLFQGSTDPTAAFTPAEARALWEAELQSFEIDTLTGAGGAAPFTTPIGYTYSETGNGSTISWDGNEVDGSRGAAQFIQFDVTFPTFVNAVGFDVEDNDGGTMDLLLTDAFTGVVTTFNFQSTPGSGDDEFFGVVFDTSTFISSLRVSGTDPGGLTDWDNFTTGVGANVVINPNNPVPVPGTLVLLGLGLAMAGSLKARRG